MLAAWQIGDVSLLHRYYADNVAVVSGLDQPVIQGWKNYRADYQAQRKRVQSAQIIRRNTFVVVHGDVPGLAIGGNLAEWSTDNRTIFAATRRSSSSAAAPPGRSSSTTRHSMRRGFRLSAPAFPPPAANPAGLAAPWPLGRMTDQGVLRRMACAAGVARAVAKAVRRVRVVPRRRVISTVPGLRRSTSRSRTAATAPSACPRSTSASTSRPLFSATLSAGH